MRPSIKQDFEPEDLLGNTRYGIAVVDQDRRLLFANSAFFKLTRADPDRALGGDVAMLWPQPDTIRDWLVLNGQSRILTVNCATHELDLQQSTVDSPESALKALFVSDASERLDLMQETERIAGSAETETSALRRRAEAAVLIKYFLRYAQEPSNLEACLSEAGRLGEALFPEGGVIAMESNPGTLTSVRSWGSRLTPETFPIGSSPSWSAEGSDTSDHEWPGLEIQSLLTSPGQSAFFVRHANPDLDEVASIYVRAFKLALSNATP